MPDTFPVLELASPQVDRAVPDIRRATGFAVVSEWNHGVGKDGRAILDLSTDYFDTPDRATEEYGRYERGEYDRTDGPSARPVCIYAHRLGKPIGTVWPQEK